MRLPRTAQVIVTGKFVTLDPGSRAKRYFAGFGAGKSSVKVVGEVKDASGKTLATFEQRRIGAMGLGGGDSLGKLMADSRSIGEDVAKFMGRWARGDGLPDCSAVRRSTRIMPNIRMSSHTPSSFRAQRRRPSSTNPVRR